jgi:hypothetical protein
VEVLMLMNRGQDFVKGNRPAIVAKLSQQKRKLKQIRDFRNYKVKVVNLKLNTEEIKIRTVRNLMMSKSY